MKKKSHLLKNAVLLCTVFSMSFTPVFASDEAPNSFTDTTTAPADETDKPTEDSTQPSLQPDDSTSTADDSGQDDSTSIETPGGDVLEPMKDSQQSSQDDSKTSLEGSSKDSSEDSSKPDEDKKTVEFKDPRFNAATNELTCSFVLNKVPEKLAYQFNWKNDGDTAPIISEEPVSVMIGTREFKDFKPLLLSNKATEGEYKFNFSSVDLKDVKDGDTVTIVFQAYPAYVENPAGDEISYTQQAYTGTELSDNDNLTDEKLLQDENLFYTTNKDLKVTQDLAISYIFNANKETKAWQMQIALKARPDDMKLTLQPAPAVFKKDGIKVMLDGKEVKPTITENKEGDKQTLELAFSSEDVAKMTDKSIIDIDFPLDISKDTGIKVDMDINNGVHVLPLTVEFNASLNPFTVNGKGYDQSSQTFTATVKLNQDPDGVFFITFSQSADLLKKPTSIKMKNGTAEKTLEIDKDVEVAVAKDSKGFDEYTIRFKDETLKEIRKDTEITAVFPVNTAKTPNGTVYVTVEDASTVKSWQSEIKQATPPKSTSNVNTGTDTGMIAAVAALIVAAIGIVFFAFKSRKSKK